MSDAKQLNGLAANGKANAQNSGGEYQQNTWDGPTGRTVHPAKGEAPKSAMIDGPYGGKKPA